MQTTEIPPIIAGVDTVTAFDEIDEILRSKDFVQVTELPSKAFLYDTLLRLHHDAHFERRRIVSPLFSRAALVYYEQAALLPVIAQAFEGLKSDRSIDGLVRADLATLMSAMVPRIAARITGIDGVDTPEATERFRVFIQKLSDGVRVDFARGESAEVVRSGFAVRDEFVEEFIGASMDRRRALVADFHDGHIAATELPRDILTSLYLHGDEAWDDELPLREASLFLVASTQTTTDAVPHVVVHLLEWFQAHPADRGLAHDAEFVRLAVNESLRLHAPNPALQRIATKDVVLSSGRRVRADERLALLVALANRDQDVFGEDADSFNPHRPTGSGKRPWGLSFGAGEHLCIGRPLVTGLSTRTDEQDGTLGTSINIVLALFDAGVELDPERAQVRTQMSYYDAYSSCPVILRLL